MASSVNPRSTAKRSFRPSSALATAVAFTDAQMVVTFADGRVVGVPLAWFPTLLAATRKQRAAVEIGGGGIGLHWPELDEDILVSGLLAGVSRDSSPPPNRETVVKSLDVLKRVLDGSGAGDSSLTDASVEIVISKRPNKVPKRTKPLKRVSKSPKPAPGGGIYTAKSGNMRV